jgi:hypothetical protein
MVTPQISATRACKEDWRLQGLVFSSVLSVRKSVSDGHLFIYKTFLFCVSIEDKHTEPVLLCEYFRHCDFWYQVSDCHFR